jgi:chromosome segregation ATPase
MASNSEVGHAKNVANFQDLIAFVEGYGPIYNPSKTSLTAEQLTALHATANASLQNVINLNTAYNDAVNSRVEAFADLRPLSTRLVNALEATDASQEKIDDAKGYNRKIQGQRATKEEPLDPNVPAPRRISASQQSYDQLIQHFEGLISVLASEPSYAPNETELQITSLQARAQDLSNKNNQEASADTAVSNARLERNRILYQENTGLVDTALDVKKYVKSLFGASSPEYNQIKGIKFKKYKD